MVSSAPQHHGLSFAPAWKLSVAAVAAVAVVVIAAWLVGPLFGGGPVGTESPGPMASVTAEPTPSAGPTATVEPTAVPTPGIVAWDGLEWAVGITAEGSCWDINDIVQWGDGYVGVGSSRERSGGNCIPTSVVSPAFFTSADGLRWTLAQTEDPVPDESQGGIPERLVRVGESLIAMDHPFSGAPELWRTTDGSSWSPLDSPTWRDALATNTLVSVAGGSGGVVVVGAEGRSGATAQQGLPVILHSSDGVTWDRLDLSSIFDKAYFWDVTAYASGYAIVGRVGEPDVVGGEPAVGVPAAWTSDDGVTWVAAIVEGAQATGARLETVIAGANGLFATGRQTDTIKLSGRGPASGWASTDGRSWRLVGVMGTDLPLGDQSVGAHSFVGDGAHMVMFGRESCKTTELLAWTSLDGVTWTPLTFSGAIGSLPTIAGPICNDDGTQGSTVGGLGITHAIVVRDGVFVIAASSAPTAPTYWFLTATTP